MKELLKKVFVCLSVCSLLLVSGCQKEEKPQEEQVELIPNTVYEAPKNPTQEQVKVYNELSNALKNNASGDELAKWVAINFSYEFFSLYGKTGKEDVGGLTFIPKDDQDDFKSFAMYKYYNNYQTVVSQYSEEDLPNVILHEVGKVEPSQITYNNLVFEGYVVTLTLKYADSKIPANSLKTNVSVQVIDQEGVYQVIAVEDAIQG